MPRYYIHTDDGDRYLADEEGCLFENAQAAREAAIDALPDMARDKLPDGDRRKFLAMVQDENGTIIYEASLELRGDWKIAHPPH